MTEPIMKISPLLSTVVVLASLLGGGCLETGTPGGLQPPADAESPRLEASGLVTNVADGDTFDVEGFGRVRLADIDAPEMDTPAGKAAKFFAETILDGEIVYLDIDDLRGRDRYGRWICLAYVEDPETGELVNFNGMLVASGHAVVKDFEDNEFDPTDWKIAYRL